MSSIAEPVIQRWLTTPLREAHPGVVERVRDLLRATQPHGYVGTCLATKAFDTRSVLARIVHPTFVMIDDQDTGTPVETVREITTHVPDARLKVTPHTAHLAPIEQKGGFLTDLNRFLGHAGCGSQCDTP